MTTNVSMPAHQQIPIWKETRNARHLVGDIAWFGVALPALSSFLAIFAINLGASALQLGLLTSLPAIMMLLATPAVGWWTNRYESGLQAIIWPSLISRFRLLLPIFIPFLPPDWRVPALILIMAFMAIPTSFSNITFLVLLREVTSDARLNGIVSRRNMIMNLAVAGSTLALGFWLERAPYPLNYQVMFIVGFAAVMVSFWHLTRLQILPQTADRLAVRTPDEEETVRHPWRNKRFKALAPVVALLFIGQTSIVSVIPLRLVDDLGASEGFFSIYYTLELIGAATLVAFAPRFITRYGHRTVVMVAMFVTATAAVILAGAPVLLLTLPAALLTGAGWATSDMVQFSYFSQHIKEARHTTYTTAYFQMISIAIFIGPLIGSTLASAGISLSLILLLGGVLRVAAGLLMRFYQTPAPAQTV